MKPTRRSWIAYPDRYVITPSVGSKWPFLWWRWSKNWTLFTPALACQTTITLETCFPGRNSIIYFCSTFPISFLMAESFWLHLCQGLRALTVPILRGHLRPLNSHSLMLICVIIQFVLLFDKVLAFCQYFSNVQMRHRQINIIIVVKKLLAWRCPVTSLERTLSLILKPIFRLGTNVVSKNLLQVRILEKISKSSITISYIPFLK